MGSEAACVSVCEFQCTHPTYQVSSLILPLYQEKNDTVERKKRVGHGTESDPQVPSSRSSHWSLLSALFSVFRIIDKV